MTELISQYRYAKNIGKSPQHVNTLVKKGIIVLVDSKVDPAQADKAIKDNSSAARAKFKKGGVVDRATMTFQEANTAKEEARAKLAQLQVREKEGELIQRVDVERGLVARNNVIKNRIRSIAPKCAQRVAALKVGKKSQRVLMAEIEELLSLEHDEALEALGRYKPE